MKNTLNLETELNNIFLPTMTILKKRNSSFPINMIAGGVGLSAASLIAVLLKGYDFNDLSVKGKTFPLIIIIFIIFIISQKEYPLF